MLKQVARWFRGQQQTPIPVPTFSVCESGNGRRWHIRKLSAAGLKYGGGIDTDGLCGLPKANWGWDLEVPIEQHLDGSYMCRTCVEKYQQWNLK